MLLFNKCDDWDSLACFEGHRVLWYWDRVREPDDSTLARRNEARRNYVERAMQVATHCFFTDGDWVDFCRLRGTETHQLSQGFDERQTFPDIRPEKRIPILFTGSTRGCGVGRAKWFHEMQNRWGKDFYHVEHGCHGERMACLIRQAKVVVAPSFPCTDRYWSNRVYNALGFGCCLLHPYSKGLFDQYDSGALLYYDSMDYLHHVIAETLSAPEVTRDGFADQGKAMTFARHLYRHRVEKLIKEVNDA